MFIVESGALRVSKRLDPADNDDLTVNDLGPGDYVGELGLLYNRLSAVSVSVQGDKPAKVLRLRRSDFQTVLHTLTEPEEPETCSVDLLLQEPKRIFLISDATGESAQRAVNLALKQFEYSHELSCGGAEVITFPFVRYEVEILEITRRARSEGALIVYTLLRPELRDFMTAETTRDTQPGEEPLRAVDLWEPMIAQLEVLFGVPRKPGAPPTRMQVSDECLRMIDAIEFTQEQDDGSNPQMWKEADVILLGLSRAGKTPLSFFLAQRGYKVANYPIVPDEEPPKELFDPELKKKIVALTIKPERLQAVRSERMRAFGKTGKSTYASLQNCSKEVGWLKIFYMRHGRGWPIVDTTNGGVEENADKIIKIIAQHRDGPDYRKSQISPSFA